MTDTEILKHAKSYIDKLANGINPLTNEAVSENDVVNNVRISRCLFYVSDVLRQVIEGKTFSSEKKIKKKSFSLSADKINEYVYSNTAVTVSEIANQLNKMADLEECRKITYSQITDWLIEAGALTINEYNGKALKHPTQLGNEIGISIEKRVGYNGEYTAVLYNTAAQHFIIDNLNAITEFSQQNKAKPENEGRAWTDAHTECLVELYQKQVPVSEIAVTLQRTEAGIKARLVKLGLIKNRSEAK